MRRIALSIVVVIGLVTVAVPIQAGHGTTYTQCADRAPDEACFAISFVSGPTVLADAGIRQTDETDSRCKYSWQARVVGVAPGLFGEVGQYTYEVGLKQPEDLAREGSSVNGPVDEERSDSSYWVSNGTTIKVVAKIHSQLPNDHAGAVARLTCST